MEVLNKENRRAFEKIISHMNKYNFIPNDNLFELILNICDKYYYPSLLKNFTDELVLNKNFILSGKNFTKYIHVLSLFKETEEYIVNLVESSYSDFKLPVKSEFYEYLILNSILNGEYKKIHLYIESLNKRYLTDYPNERIRNSEIFAGNMNLINSLVEIYNDFKQNEDYRLNYNESLNLNENELNKIFNSLIQSCKGANKSWFSDERFLKLLYSINSKINFNLEEVKSLTDNLFKNIKIESKVNDEIINGILINTIDHLISFIKKNKEEEVRKILYFITNLLKNNSSKFTPQNKDLLYREENIKKLIDFIRENPTMDNKEALKNFVKDSFEIKRLGNIDLKELDLIRKLAYLVFEDGRQISDIFMENKERLSNRRIISI